MTSDSSDDDTVLPSMSFLKQNQQIQRQMDDRLQELATVNDKGNYKSQRGGNETVWVQNQIPWPKNKVLTGASKSRVSVVIRFQFNHKRIPLWVRGSRIGPTCPPACHKRRLNGGVISQNNTNFD